MSKVGRVRGDRGPSDKLAPVPYSTITRRERSRKLAQKRRDTYKQIMDDMIDVMPFPKDVVSQLDYNSRLRLTICFFRMKALLKANREEEEEFGALMEPGVGPAALMPGEKDEKRRMSMLQVAKPKSFQSGMLQDLMCEALDGFLMVTQLDGTIVYLSDSIHKHLGLFQSEHIGINMYDLILEDDHKDVKQRLSEADEQSVKRKTKYGATEVSFFCRMKCSRFKLANTVAKSPSFKLVHVSGALKVAGDEPFITCVVRPVTPPSVLELRMEGNMFVAHYSMTFSCIYFDGRLRHLLGYTKEDFLGKTPFSFQHHDDIEATMKCSRDVQRKGEGVSGYYRFLNRFGEYIWIQSRAVMVTDSCSGKPSHIVCTSFVISKEDGNKDLLLRQAIASGQSEFIEKAMTTENSFALKKQAEAKNGVTAPLQKRDDGLASGSSSSSMSGGSSLIARLKSKEPVGTINLSNGGRSSEGQIFPADSGKLPSNGSNGKSAKSSSLLYSMLSGRSVSPPQTLTNHSSTSPAASSVSPRATTDELALSPANSTISSSSLGYRGNVTLQKNTLDSGYMPDSTTHSNESSPYNLSSVQQQEERAIHAFAPARAMRLNDRTMSGSDLGYHSESNSSIRERLASSFTGYESESSSYMYESGTDTSPPDPYSPDYPLSVVSSDGSMTSHVSFMTASPSESHSSPLFQNPGSIHSIIDEAVGSPTYFVPMDEGGDFRGRYPQQSLSVDLSTDSESESVLSVGLQRSKVSPQPPLHQQQQQWSPGSSTSSPPQFMASNVNGNGENPVNYDERGLAYAKMEPVSSALTSFRGNNHVTSVPSHNGFCGDKVTMNGNLRQRNEETGGYQYTNGHSLSLPLSQPRNVHTASPSSSSSSSLLLGDVFITSVSGGSSSHSSTQSSVALTQCKVTRMTDLPQLTVEDLQVLDAFSHSKDEDQFGQLLYQQTALSCRGTMMM